jgi:hypothetical protein
MTKIKRKGSNDNIPLAPPLADAPPPPVPSAHAIDSINIEPIPFFYM